MQITIETVRDAREACRAIESFLAGSHAIEVQPVTRLEDAREATDVLKEALGRLRGDARRRV